MKLDIDSAILASKVHKVSKQYPKAVNDNDLNEVVRFENKTVSRDLYKMELDRYEELLPFVYYLKKYANCRINEDAPINEFLFKYDRINKRLKYSEVTGLLRTDIGEIKVDESDINLLTALATDSEFSYLQGHFYCTNNNLDEEQYFNKKYGFYSKKLIVIEEYIYIIFKRYEKDFKLPEVGNVR